MSHRLRFAFAALFVCACATPATIPPTTDPSDAGVGELERQHLVKAVAQLEADIARWLGDGEERLWAQWTHAAVADGGVSAPLEAERFATLRRARELAVDSPRALNHLERTLVNEQVRLAVAPETDAVITLENTLTFQFEGKDVRLRDVHRMLANERSALKRKALWVASRPAAQTLDEALTKRDAAVAAAAGKPAFDFWCSVRDVDAKTLEAESERVLTETDAAWRAALEKLNAYDTRLPAASLTRADLPRVLRVPPEVDQAFPRGQVAARAVATLSGLGLYGLPGLTLELSDASKKNPLPLTVSPRGANDVRVSFRPLGGLSDQSQLLSELGVALARRHAKAGRPAFDTLGDATLAQASGVLFERLVTDSAWLEANQVDAKLVPVVAATAEAHRLFHLRRAAATFLAQAKGLDRANTAALFTRAFAVTHTEADVSRAHLDEGLRSATALRANVVADVMQKHLTAPWFTKPESAAFLERFWAKGSREPAETLPADTLVK